MESALKTQLVQAVDEIYIKSLKNKYTGYANHTTKEILDHLYKSYANITAATLQENDLKMRGALDPTQPIEALFARVEECQELAAAGNTPYTQEQILNIAYQAIFASGLYQEGCREWRRKPAATKSWTTFKALFTDEYLDLKEAAPTTAGAAFQVQPHHQDTVEAIANLATATASDREAVASLTAANSNLTATNNRLTEELIKANRELVAALRQVQSLTKQVQDLSGGRPRTSSYPSSHSTSHYCWTCGTNSPHPSHKCDKKKPNHQDKATKYNMMGGNTNKFHQ